MILGQAMLIIVLAIPTPAITVVSKPNLSIICVNISKAPVPVSTIPFKKPESNVVIENSWNCALNCWIFHLYSARFATSDQLLFIMYIVVD